MKGQWVRLLAWIAVVAVVVGTAGFAGSLAGTAFAQGDDEPDLMVSPDQGVLIAAVLEGGPADDAGVVRGDILLDIDQEPVDTVDDLVAALEELDAGDEVELVVLHGDDVRILTATVDEDEAGRTILGVIPCEHPAMMMEEEPALPDEESSLPVMPQPELGALILEVSPDSPAEEAGLIAGERITEIDGQEVADVQGLVTSIRNMEPGDTVVLTIEDEEGEAREVEVELGENPDDETLPYLGVMVIPIPPDDVLIPDEEAALPDDDDDLDEDLEPPLDEALTLPEMPEGRPALQVQSVVAGSPAEDIGLQPGDLIVAVDGVDVATPWTLSDAVREHEPGGFITLTLLRGPDGEEETVRVQLGETPTGVPGGFLGIRTGFGVLTTGEPGDAADDADAVEPLPGDPEISGPPYLDDDDFGEELLSPEDE